MASLNYIHSQMLDLFDEAAQEVADKRYTLEDAVAAFEVFGAGDGFRDFWAYNKEQYID